MDKFMVVVENIFHTHIFLLHNSPHHPGEPGSLFRGRSIYLAGMLKTHMYSATQFEWIWLYLRYDRTTWIRKLNPPGTILPGSWSWNLRVWSIWNSPYDPRQIRDGGSPDSDGTPDGGGSYSTRYGHVSPLLAELMDSIGVTCIISPALPPLSIHKSFTASGRSFKNHRPIHTYIFRLTLFRLIFVDSLERASRMSHHFILCIIVYLIMYDDDGCGEIRLE